MEESPFEKYQKKTAVLYVEPLLDTYNKTYVSALTVNIIPDGPIKQMVRVFNTPTLSPFQTFTNSIHNGDNCTFIIMKYPNGNKGISKNWMLEEDIPTIFSYLQQNNYSIDTSLTKLINHSQVNLGGVSQIKRTGNRRMVCMFSFPNKV